MKFKMTQDEENQQFFFSLFNNDDNLLLNSAGFADRDACVASIRNLVQQLPQRAAYQLAIEPRGSYFRLNNATGAALAQSPNFDSSAEATEALNSLVADAVDETDYQVDFTAISTSTVLRTEVLPSLADIDYESLYDFSYNSQSNQAGFDSFVRTDGSFSFHYNNATGQPLLYNRSFDSAGRRDKRIRQVIKASSAESRYEIKEADGQFYYILKERNNAEIARSRRFATQAEAQDSVQYCLTNIPQYANQYPEPEAKEAKKRKGVNEYGLSLLAASTDVGFHPLRGEDKQHYFLLNGNAGTPLLFGQGYSGGAARDSGIKTVIRNAGDERRYELKAEGGKSYFVLRSANRQEIARSADFDSPEAAQNAMQWIMKTVPGYAAQYGVEISKPETTTTVETDSFTIDVLPPVLVAAVAPVVKSETERDNYLPCNDYANGETIDEEDFTVFKKDDEHYFSMLDRNKDVLLRSEGYPTTAARDNGIRSVKTNRDLRERYSMVEEDNEHFVILKAANHREIARSCPHGSQVALLALFPFLGEGATGGFPWVVAGLAAAGLGLAGTAMAQADATPAILPLAAPEAIPPIPVPAVEETVAFPAAEDSSFAGALTGAGVLGAGAIAAALAADVDGAAGAATPVGAAVPVGAVTPVGAASGGRGGWGWLPWLLGALLLAALLWWLLRGCAADKPAAVVVPPADTTQIIAKSTVPVVVPTDSATVATTPPVGTAFVCNCSNNADKLFNIPTDRAPKVLYRLGSNPEFGDSHALSPEEFYQKIKNRAAINRGDKQFLDRVFKGMGYANGFADAKPEMFSNTVIPKGASGNLGYSKQHKTQYSTLDNNDRDLQAFHIKSANGCDMHFMKTCGNHFFYCPK